MSRRLPKSRRSGKRMESVKKFFGIGSRRKEQKARKPRHLVIDPLETRQLLSVSVGNLSDVLVSQTASTTISTIAGQSMAVDHTGDAIVVWTRIDAVLDDSGNPVNDPRTGLAMTDSNIFARYLTNEVQRIVLPQSLITNNPTKLGTPFFSLLYSAGEIQQQLSFTSMNPGGTNLVGTFQLGINLNGDDNIDPAQETTIPIVFDESNWNSTNASLNSAALIQKALRDLGSKGGDVANMLQNATVTAVDSLHYTITYPFVYEPSSDPAAPAIPNLMIAGQNFLANDGGQGYLPSVEITTLRQPTLVGIKTTGAPNIPLSLTKPEETALAIEQAFQMTTQGYPMAPVMGGPNDTGPIEFRAPVATIKVVSVKTVDDPLGLRTFDITFVGNSGLQDHPLLFLGNKLITDQKQTFTLTNPERQIATITKMSSPEFRVNPLEPDNPFTPLPDVTQQSMPAVAMDADGDFVITWQSEVLNEVTPGSKYDIFAQRFSPAAIVNAPNLVISKTKVSLLEGDNTTVSVKLASVPVYPVTVTITRQDGSDADIMHNVTTLTFTPANWNTPQSVTIFAAHDANKTNDTASFNVSTGGFTTQTIVVNEIDLNSLIVSKANLSVEEAASNTFTVRLAKDPGKTITVNVGKVAGGDNDLTADKTTLTFDSSNWNLPQMVTVSAARETGQNQDALNGTASFTLTPNDTDYASAVVNAAEADDWATLIVSTNALQILEGGSGVFTVRLSGRPTGNVTVNVLKQSGGDESINTQGVTTLNFTPGNWDQPQDVTVRAGADLDSLNGTAIYYLVGPNNAPVETVMVTKFDQPILNVEYDDPSFTYVRVAENGSGVFYVSLPFQPKTNVTVTITPDTGGDPALRDPNPLTLTFTPNNWNRAQAVVISADDDTPTPGTLEWPEFVDAQTQNEDGARKYFIYAPGFTTQLINAVKINNDSWNQLPKPDPLPDGVEEPDVYGKFNISASNVYVPEGSRNYLTVSLTNRPEGEVVVYVSRVGGDADITGGTGAPDITGGEPSPSNAYSGAINPVGVLVFNENNWNQPQYVTFFAREDNDLTDGLATYVFTMEAAFPEEVTVTEADNDWRPSNLTVSQPSFYMKEGSGPTATFTVTSTADTTVDIVRDLARSWPGDPSFSVSPIQVTLNAGNNHQATITITAGNDTDPQDFLNGLASFLVTAYQHSLRLVTVTQLDKEVSPVILSTDLTGLSIGEGEAAVVTARLSYKPAADTIVTITKQAGGDGEINTLTTTLTFTADNWNQPQKLVFTAQDDADTTNGTATYSFTMAGFVDKVLAISERDNDAQAIIISTDQMPVLEGNSRTFDVTLPFDPLDKAVIVNIVRESGSSDLQAAQTTLVFVGSQWVAPTPNPYPNATLWNVVQKVRINALSNPNSDHETATFRISAVGYTDAVLVANAIEKVQSIRPLGNAFRVNTFTVDAQYDPAVTMDSDGNFVITWSNQGQDISFFNGIVGQRFNRDGDRMGNEFMVNDEDTHTHDDSYVSLSPDGQFFLVTWVMNGSATLAEPGSLLVKVYNMRQSDILGFPTVRYLQSNLATIGVDQIVAPTAAWNSINDFVITWDWPQFDADHTTATPSDGVYGVMFEITQGQIIRIFRANSGNIDPGTLTSWPNGQSGNQVAVDTDGDLTVIYSGFGTDTTQNTIVAADWYAAALQQMQTDPLFANSPLLGLLSDLVSHGLATPFHPFVHDGDLHPIGDDTDLVIQEFMTIAYNYGATQTQLGRLQQIMSNVANLMRGDGNGVMFTQYDADPVLGNQNVLNSDNIVNSYRDGTNDVVVIAVDQFANEGEITFVINDGIAVTVEPAWADMFGTGVATIDPDATAQLIHDALTSAYRDITGEGLNWPEDPWTAGGPYEGPFDFRVISAGEWYARQNTYWELNDNQMNFNPNPADIGKRNPIDRILTSAQYFIEITVQGELHDSFGFALADSSLTKLNPMGPDADPESVPAFINQVKEYSSNLGTDQSGASIGMQPGGSFSIGYTQTNLMPDGLTESGDTVLVRNFVESTDTAGPVATDFILRDNTRLQPGGQVLNPVQYLVVTFDEELATTGVGSVLNKANWSLMKDNVLITGGISEIYFGMNMASQITDKLGVPLFPGFVGTNKYEAVIKLDANGVTADTTTLPDGTKGTPLTSGHYDLVVLNSMRDVAGNPLGRSGFIPNGYGILRSFDVSAITTSETPVNNTVATGSQTTQTHDDSPSAPSVPHAVANDGNGDYVVVWTDTTLGHEGVWAKLYRQTWTLEGTTRKLTSEPYAAINPATGLAWANNEIRVSSDPSDTYASVAMDGDGDFVITWSRDDSSKATEKDPDPSWNVYARRYNALGQAKTDDPFNPAGGEFLANTETQDIQRYSDVAMDVDGDFIVTWQSMNQDGSGYGVYMQRYSPEGRPLGGLNDVQQINFVGRPQGTFKLQWVDGNDVEHYSEKITLPTDNDLSKIVDDIQTALEAMGAQVIVSVSGDTTIMVEFVDTDANTDQSQLIIPADSVTNLTGDPGRRITVTTLIEGAPGEFRVNDTTLNDQMFPSIGANATGDYVITWTAYGTNDDFPWQSDIYAKQILSNDSYKTAASGTSANSMSTTRPSSGGSPFVTSVDAPANHVVQPGTGFDGVVQIFAGGGAGSGSLLSDGIHILTAAHVVTNGADPVSADLISVIFTLTTGAVTIQASEVFVHPNYNGDPFATPDIAILTLSEPAPEGVVGYGLYRGTDEVGKVMDFYGYGNWGTGQDGADPATFGILHHGKNKWEGTGDLFGDSNNLLVYDFDDGTAAMDAFGTEHSIVDLGLGTDEACQAHGDSGGPSLLNGLIAAVCTGGIPSTVDNDGTPFNSSFGEYGADTRVSMYLSWIDSIVGIGSPEFLVNSITVGQQKWSSVALDSAGDFVISWTSYGIDGTGSGAGAGVFGMNGVYARRFSDAGVPAADDFKVNTFGAFDQQRPQVAMTPDGDFDIAWESFQDRASWDPSGIYSDSPSSFGVYAQRYAGPGNTSPYLGLNREMGSEIRLNSTLDGDQRYPSIAMDANGDLIAVWTGATPSNPAVTKIYSQRFDQQADTAGPFVTNVFDATTIPVASTPRTVYDNSSIANYVTSFIVAFDENMSVVGGAGGTHSILNPNNWQLSKTGYLIEGGVKSVQWVNSTGDHRNPLTGKFEVLVTFDMNPEDSDTNLDKHILKQGLYTLTISDTVQDYFKNSLDGNYDGVNGGSFTFNFTIDLNATDGTPTDDPISDNTVIANAQTFPESAQAIATTLNGNHIVTWTAYDSTLGRDRIFYKLFDADGTAYTNRLELTASSDFYYDSNSVKRFFKDDHQRYATIACDGDGDFVITWSNFRANPTTGAVLESDVFARRFNAKGEAQGAAFRVNTYTTNDQKWSNVTMDAKGNFIITWSSLGQEDDNQLGKGFGVYARRYNAYGQALAPEFRVNTTTAGNQQNSSVAMANDGSFMIVWQTDQIQGQFDIYGRIFNPDGTPNEDYGTYLTGELVLNQTQAGNQQYPDIAMSPDGSQVIVVWQSSAQDGNGWGIYQTGVNLLGGFLMPESKVNTSVLGDQLFPSVAMAYNGKYTITWSGLGDRPGQADQSGSGVFFRQYQANGSSIGGETRANKVIVGDQWISSVAVDQRGKAYIVFTGPSASTGTNTSIYRYISPDSPTFPDNVSAITTEVGNTAFGSIVEGSVVTSNDLAVVLSGKQYAQLNVYFSEKLSTEGGVTGQHSVLNKQNWRLYRNNVEITGAVTDIIFGWDATTRKWRAQLTLDDNGFLGGTSSLTAGDYQLVVSESIWDSVGNALDGDFDGLPGTNPTVSSQPGYKFLFSVADSTTPNAEIRVNSPTNSGYNQAFSESYGTGFGREQTHRSVAIDHNGDFAVVWTSYGQDDSTDLNGGGIYMRLFDNNNNLLGDKSKSGDILVNTATLGNQRNATVAMSADGNIIVVWQSEGADPDGTTGIYGQMFDSLGNKIGTEFRINTYYTNHQVDPAVAADAYGNFVVVWATAAQSSSYFNDVRGQIFDLNGQKVGNEFLVNTVNIPGDSEIHPAVAMNYSGNFVVSWDQVATVGNTETNGTINNTVVMARMFDPLGVAKGAEFQADLPNNSFLSDPQHLYPHHLSPAGGGETNRQARNPQVAIDAQGNFIIAWESWRDNDIFEEPVDLINSYGIYYRRFLADGTPQMSDFTHQANLTITALDPHDDHPFYTLAQSALYAGSQVNPTIAMDVDGDFIIAWDGNGAQPNRVGQEITDWSSLADDQGIFGRTFHAQEEVVQGYNDLLPEEYTSEQSRVNMTAAGSQKFPSTAMMPNGEYVVVWSGNGVGDQSGIFARRYKESTDTAGPLMTRISGSDGKSVLNVLQDPTYTLDDISSQMIAGAEGVKYLTVTFDEAMLEGNSPNSVTNPANYRLTREGAAIPLAIDHIEYAKNPLTNKYEAKIFLKQPITLNGTYTLTAFSPKAPSAANPSGSSGLCDKKGNPLGRTGFENEGTDFFGTFRVLAGLPSTVTKPGTPDASDTSLADIQVNSITTNFETAPRIASNANGDFVVVWVSKDADNLGDIMAQRYDRIGRPLGAEFQISSYQEAIPTTTTTQNMLDVAMDAYGNFVVVWAGEGVGETSGVFGRVFDTSGVATGDDFLVNQFVLGKQDRPSVAMDAAGNFVVTWSSTEQASDSNGVFARRFNVSGTALGNEFLVNSPTAYMQQSSDIAMDDSGNFTIVWQSDQQDGSSWGIYGQRYNAAGQRLGGEFQINSYTTDKQTDPQIAMAADGNFMVVWTSFGQDGSGYGVYGRRYSPTGVARETSEFRVNKTSTNWQYEPSVSASKNGNFVVVWSALGRDDPFNEGYGIYGHVFTSSGASYIDPATGAAMDEFRINISTPGPQVQPAVTMDADGDFMTAWVGPTKGEPTSSHTQVYARITAINPSTYLPILPKSATGTMSAPKNNNNPVDNKHSISGTAGNDSFEFFAAATPASWTLKINGVKQNIPATATGVSLDGLGGNDTIKIVGIAGSQNLEIDGSRGKFMVGSYELALANLENYLLGDLFCSVATLAQASDTILMYGVAGSAGGKTFTASPTSSVLSLNGNSINAKNFRNVQAYIESRTGNTATFTDSSGDDLYLISYMGGDMQYRGNNTRVSAWGFNNVNANSATGKDEVRFYGKPGATDSFVASSTEATYTNPSFVNKATGFKDVQAYIDPNNNSTATLIGTAGNDRAVTSPLGSQMFATGFQSSAWNFKHVNVQSNGGNDSADMYGYFPGEWQVQKNTYVTDNQSTSQSGGFGTQTFNNNLSGYATVKIHGNSATSDSVTLDNAVFNANDLVLDGNPYSHKLVLNSIDELFMTTNKANPTPHAIDQVMKAYW